MNYDRNRWDNDYEDHHNERESNQEWRPTNSRNRNDHEYNTERRGYQQYSGSSNESNYKRPYQRSGYGSSSYDQGSGNEYSSQRGGTGNYRQRSGYSGSGRQYGQSGYGSAGNYDQQSFVSGNRYDRGNRFGQSGYGSRSGISNYEVRRDTTDYSRRYDNSYDPGVGYNRNYHKDAGYDRNTDYRRHESNYDRDDRGFFDKAGDEIASWFGDDDARRRREMDQRYNDYEQTSYRGRGPKNYKRSDERIQEDVNDRLSDDWHLDASDVTVSVEGGDVILSGTVGSRYDKRYAEDLAERVSGVSNVENRIRVNANTRGSSFSSTGTSVPSATTGSTATTGKTAPAAGATRTKSSS